MLLLGTGARPGALADLTAGQIDILRRRIDLHPLGAPETGKRNGPADRPVAHAVGVRAEGPLRRRAPYEVVAGQLGGRARSAPVSTATLCPTIRHTLATWMSEQNVPEGELVAWFGHGKESTTRRWYIKRRSIVPTISRSRRPQSKDLLIAVKREAGETPISPASEPDQLAVCVTNVSATNRTGTRNP